MKLNNTFYSFAVLVFIILPFVGAIYEISAQKQAYINYPPTGKLIDIGGRNIHLDCRFAMIIAAHGLSVFQPFGKNGKRKK